MSLPTTQRATVLRSFDQLPEVETVPVPEATPGSAVIQVLAANVVSYMREIYNGQRNYPRKSHFPSSPLFAAAMQRIIHLVRSKR